MSGFLRNIWKDDRSWDGGPTSFFTVHQVLAVASLMIGSAVGWLGLRGARAVRHRDNGEDASSEPLINSGS